MVLPARPELSAGGDARPRRRQLQRLSPSIARRRAAAVRSRRRCRGPSRVIDLDPTDQPHLPLLARLRPGRRGRARSTPIASTGRSTRREGCASIRARCCSIPTDSASPSRPATAARPPQAGRQHRHGDEERGRRSERATTGKATRRCAGRSPRRSSTRCTCAASRGIPARASRRQARHLRRADREDPVPAGSRHHRGRAAAGVCSSTRRTARRARSTTGATSPLSFFAPHHGLQLATGPARRARRVPRHGQGAAPRRHRGDPRRRLQPHRRRRRRRPDALLPRADNETYYILADGQVRATPTTPAAATRSTPTTRSSAG